MSNAAFQVPRHHINLYKEQSPLDPIPNDPGMDQEIFHNLYSEAPNKLPEVAGNHTRHAVHNLISELPEFETLKMLTMRDPMWASMATQSLGTKIAQHIPANANVDHANAVLDGLNMMQAEMPSVDLSSHITKAIKGITNACLLDDTNAKDLDASSIRHALRAAIEQASQDINQADEALGLLGGHHGSSANTYIDTKVALELARKVKSSPTLSKIIELAGKLTRTARAKRAARSEYARSEVVGVEQTGHVERLLGSEMALLCDPTMSDDLMIRLFENKALGYKMSGKEKLAKGPIVLMLDQSGSMSDNNKDVWAKAIALAIYDTAREDNREFAMVLYNHECIGGAVIKSPQDMLDMLTCNPNGGTEFEPAMDKAFTLTGTKSDIIHITDGHNANNALAPEYIAHADLQGMRIYGIGIGQVGQSLAMWSHEHTTISDVTKDSQAMDLLFGEGGI